MCYEEGRLVAYLDGEVTPEERAEIAAHAETCADCSANLRRLESDRAVAAEALAKLQPTGEVVSLDALRDERPAAAAPARRWSRAQIAAVAVAALVLASLAIAPVRNAAASLLQVFRVQKVQTVTISEADLQSIGAALQKGGHVDLQAFGEAWIDGTAAKPTTVSLIEAQAAVDFPVKLPTNQATSPTLLLQKAQTYRFKLHVAAINDALKTYGSDRTLPEALNDKTFEVSVPAIVLARYATPSGAADGQQGQPDGIYVGQARSPELVVPDGVDAAELRDVLVNLPFLPQSVRDQLAAVTDWQSTLLIPNVDGTAHDVTINGVKAVVITPKSAARDARKRATALGPVTDTTTVIWNDNGVVRAVGGPIDEGTAIALAKSTME